jgi:hypothetical protein
MLVTDVEQPVHDGCAGLDKRAQVVLVWHLGRRGVRGVGQSLIRPDSRAAAGPGRDMKGVAGRPPSI